MTNNTTSKIFAISFVLIVTFFASPNFAADHVGICKDATKLFASAVPDPLLARQLAVSIQKFLREEDWITGTPQVKGCDLANWGFANYYEVVWHIIRPLTEVYPETVRVLGEKNLREWRVEAVKILLKEEKELGYNDRTSLAGKLVYDHRLTAEELGISPKKREALFGYGRGWH